jgi:hypothetical protein
MKLLRTKLYEKFLQLNSKEIPQISISRNPKSWFHDHPNLGVVGGTGSMLEPQTEASEDPEGWNHKDNGLLIKIHR